MLCSVSNGFADGTSKSVWIERACYYFSIFTMHTILQILHSQLMQFIPDPFTFSHSAKKLARIGVVATLLQLDGINSISTSLKETTSL